MPLIDMPIRELEQYMGRNPKPEDHQAYWEKALADMKAVAPQLEMRPAAFQCPGVICEELYFTGVRGARIYVKHMRPTNVTGKIPAVLRFHGYASVTKDWPSLLCYVAAGCAVFAMDVRGQYGKSEDGGGIRGTTISGHIIRGLHSEDPQDLMFRDIFLDTAQLAGLVMDMDFVDENKVYATGQSQGGGLTIACAALEPRIAKAAIEYPFLSDYQRVWEMDLAHNAYEELTHHFKWFDPRHAQEEKIFRKLGYIDVQYLAPWIKAEVLMVTGLMDNICPPSTQYAAYNKMKCKKQIILYPDFGHEYLNEAQDLEFQFLVQE